MSNLTYVFVLRPFLFWKLFKSGSCVVRAVLNDLVKRSSVKSERCFDLIIFVDECKNS